MFLKKRALNLNMVELEFEKDIKKELPETLRNIREPESGIAHATKTIKKIYADLENFFSELKQSLKELSDEDFEPKESLARTEKAISNIDTTIKRIKQILNVDYRLNLNLMAATRQRKKYIFFGESDDEELKAIHEYLKDNFNIDLISDLRVQRNMDKTIIEKGNNLIKKLSEIKKEVETGKVQYNSIIERKGKGAENFAQDALIQFFTNKDLVRDIDILFNTEAKRFFTMLEKKISASSRLVTGLGKAMSAKSDKEETPTITLLLPLLEVSSARPEIQSILTTKLKDLSKTLESTGLFLRNIETKLEQELISEFTSIFSKLRIEDVLRLLKNQCNGEFKDLKSSAIRNWTIKAYIDFLYFIKVNIKPLKDIEKQRGSGGGFKEPKWIKSNIQVNYSAILLNALRNSSKTKEDFSGILVNMIKRS